MAWALFITLVLIYCLDLSQSLSFSGTVDLGKASLGISIENGILSSTATGTALSNLGDINGDGYGDIGMKSSCFFYVVLGTYDAFEVDLSTLSSSTGISIVGTVATQYCELSNIAGLGDVNGDRIDDYILVFGNGNIAVINPIYYIIYGSLYVQNIDLDTFGATTGIAVTTGYELNGLVSPIVAVSELAVDGQKRQRKRRLLSEQFLHFKKNGEEGPVVTEAFSKDAINLEYSYGGPTCPNATQAASDSVIMPVGGLGFSQTFLPLGYTGDINNDGYNDVLLVGALDSSELNFTMYIVFGSHNLGSSIDLASLSSTEALQIIGDGTSFPRLVDSYLSYDDYTVTCIDNGNTTLTTYYYYNYTTAYTAIAVFSAGDVNNDGYDDLVLGSAYGYQYAGSTFIVYGKANFTESITLSEMNQNQGYQILGVGRRNAIYFGDFSGYAVGGMFDFNNDGYDDVIIGAPGANSLYGVVYIVFGSNIKQRELQLASLTNAQGISIYSTTYAIVGNSVSSAGDFNQDGIDDVVIGAPLGAGGAGVVYLIYGTKTAVNLQVQSLTSLQGISVVGVKNTNTDYYCETGSVVSGGSDYNRDGFPDIFISAPGRQTSSTNSEAGAVYALFGTNDATSPVYLRYLSAIATFNTKQTPIAVSLLGDVNRDGYVDIGIGAFLTNDIYIVFGASTGFVSQSNLSSISNGNGIAISGFAQTWFGFSVAGCNGDFNGDGYDDSIIGSPGTSDYDYYYPTSLDYYPSAGVVNSAAYILFGSNDLQNINATEMDITILGKPYSGTGFAVTGLGNFDEDKDKLASVAIGAPYVNYCSGEVYIIEGGKNYNSTIDLTSPDSIQESDVITIVGVDFYDYTGFSLSSTDYNGDGTPDMIIGAPGADQVSSTSTSSYSYGFGGYEVGVTYIIFGRKDLERNISLTNLASSVGISIYGVSSGDFSGTAVAGVGDINGDGYADLIIGAPYSNDYAGSVYVVYGTPNPVNIYLTNLPENNVGFVLTGADLYDSIGFSVSYAGDINSDGFADIYFGAPGYNNYAGASYIIFGGQSQTQQYDLSSLSLTQGITITQDVLYAQVGYSVASVTDSKGNILTLLGNNPSVENGGVGTCYAVVPVNAPSNHTINPSARPTFSPTYVPTATPTHIPTAYPTYLPTLYPTPAPTAAPFWATNGDVILGILVPATLSFVPIYFSKQICFYTLTHWSSANRRRGLCQIAMYGLCKKVFLADFIEAMETKEKKKEIDEQLLEENKKPRIELTSLLGKMKDAPSSSEGGGKKEGEGERGDERGEAETINPLIEAEEGRASEAKKPQFRQSYDSQMRFQQSYETESRFRQSDVNIDSDDEEDAPGGGGGEGVHGGDPLSGLPPSRRSAVTMNRNVELRAVYSLRFDNPEIDRLYHGQLLLFNDIDSKKPNTAPLLEDTMMTKKQISNEMNRFETNVIQSDSGGGVYGFSNIIDDWPVFKYFLTSILVPLLSSFGVESLLVAEWILLPVFSFVYVFMENPVLLLFTHWIVGSMKHFYPFQSERQRGHSMRLPLLHSLLFAARGGLLYYLHEYSHYWLSTTDEASHVTSVVDVQHCIGVVSIYSLYQLGICYMQSYFSPGNIGACYQAKLPVQAMLSGSQCLLQRKSRKESTSLSVINIALPVAVDVCVFVYSIFQGYSVYGIVSNVVMSDSSSRLVVSMIPESMKLNNFDYWIDGMFTAVLDMIDAGMNAVVSLESHDDFLPADHFCI